MAIPIRSQLLILFLSCLYINLGGAMKVLSRRNAVKTVGSVFGIGAIASSPCAALADPMFVPRGRNFQRESTGQWSPNVATQLGTRILAEELSPIQQMPFTDQELYYAPFLFGSWKATATLKRKVYPFGKGYVPSNSLIEGSPRNREEQVGSSTTYDVHYFSTSANTMKNQVTVQLGAGSKVIADRSFNAISISKAYRQLMPIQEVEWDPRKDPTRLTVSYGTMPLADDMRPLGPRRGEVYISARQAEFVSSKLYACSERSRSVTLATRDVVVSDTESISEFELVSPNRVKATNRIAVYLTPNPNSREGVLWSEVGGKAVAFFDYNVEMERVAESFVNNGEEEQRACVHTPKDIIQCE